MSRHVNFRHDSDISLTCIFHYFPCFVLCVEAAVSNAVIKHCVEAYHRSGALRADGCQKRIFLYLYAPALVIAQMPVEHIHVVQREQIDIAFHKTQREKMARTVEHHTAMTEARAVLYLHRRHEYSCGIADRQRLAQSLHTVEHTARSASGYGDALLIHHNGVGLVALHLLVEHETHALLRLSGHYVESHFCGISHILCEKTCITFHVNISFRIANSC